MIVTVDEDGVNTPPPAAKGIVGEVDVDDDVGRGGVDMDVLEKVRILEDDGNAYLPVPTKVLLLLVVVVVVVVEVVVTLFLTEEFETIDLCKFPDDFFFNPPAGNGGNDFSLFNTIIPLVDDIIGGEAGLKISFGVLGIGILRVEEVDEGVFPLAPLLLVLLLWLLSCWLLNPDENRLSNEEDPLESLPPPPPPFSTTPILEDLKLGLLSLEGVFDLSSPPSGIVTSKENPEPTLPVLVLE